MARVVPPGVLIALALACAGCVRPNGGGSAAEMPRPSAAVRGAALYAAYCGDCHGGAGRGDGAVARAFGLVPGDLGTAVAGVTDEDLAAWVRRGEPLRTAQRIEPALEDRQVAELAAYIGGPGAREWEVLRVGRLTFERECAGCHGVYGEGEPHLEEMLGSPPPPLRLARTRYPTDEALMRVSRLGFRHMPAAPPGAFAPGELPALAAYVRELSEGGRLYDAYCAACHGMDGLRGPAPMLVGARDGDDLRSSIRHMLRREQTTMPHFGALLSPARVDDIVAYLRSW
jgi:mono/diheme cytochrome c family protein